MYGLPCGVDPGPLVVGDQEVGVFQTAHPGPGVPHQRNLPSMHLYGQEVHLKSEDRSKVTALCL